MKRKLLIIVSALFVFAVFLAGVSVLASFRLIVTEYSLDIPKIDGSLRICQLTDLHNREFGENNCELVEKIDGTSPDLVVMTGDMISRKTDDSALERLCRLISTLSEKYPVYYSLGNHETFNLNDNENLLERISRAGAVVLEYAYVDTEVNGIPIRIGGICSYLHLSQCEEERLFIEEFCDTELPTILLAHMWEGLIVWRGLELCDADIVMSGHSHGGEVRLPFIGGLYDPLLEYLPGKTTGIFYGSDTYVVVSAGLGTAAKIPRINNPCELVVLDINR